MKLYGLLSACFLVNIAHGMEIDTFEIKQKMRQAIRNDDVNTVQELLNHISINEPIKHEYSSLVYAMDHHNWDSAATLINQGADVNCVIETEWGQLCTLLHYACFREPALVRLLLEKNANTETVDSRGITPFARLIFRASCYFGYDSEIQELGLLLVQHGASILVDQDPQYEPNVKAIDILYKWTKPCAARLVFEAFKWALENNNKQRLKQLCAHNSPVIKEGIDYKDENGNTLLHMLVTTYPKSRTILWWILQAGADPDLANKEGLTPLHLAIQRQNRPFIGLLLMYGADIELPFPKTGDQITPFTQMMQKAPWRDMLLQIAFKKSKAGK